MVELLPDGLTTRDEWWASMALRRAAAMGTLCEELLGAHIFRDRLYGALTGEGFSLLQIMRTRSAAVSVCQ